LRRIQRWPLLKDIRQKYWDIRSGLNRAVYLNAPAVGEGDNATAFTPKDRDGTMRITPLFLNLGVKKRVYTLFHECAHFISDEFQEWSYRDRRGEPEPDRYDKLPVQDAIRNPDSYAYYAVQMATGITRLLENTE
jgi:hypothetical protein